MVGHVLRSLKGLKKKEGFIITVSGELRDQEKQMILGGLKYRSPAGDDGSVHGPLVDSEEDGDEVEDEAGNGEQHEEENEEDEESDESDESDEDYDEEDDDEDYESLDEEDDAAGISSTVAVMSHSNDSQDSIGKLKTDSIELEESSSSFHSEPRDI